MSGQYNQDYLRLRSCIVVFKTSFPSMSLDKLAYTLYAALLKPSVNQDYTALPLSPWQGYSNGLENHVHDTLDGIQS